jgi:Archaeal enzymes of ATP-grasp superfamily
MPETKIIKYVDTKYHNTIAVVGFPSVGLVGSILTSFVIRELDMEIIAGITSPDLPPYAIVQGGMPYPPIRVCGGIRENKTEDCGDLVIVTSEVIPKPEHSYKFVAAMINLFKEFDIKKVIILEGIPQFGENDPIMACGSSRLAKDKIDELGLKKLDDGLVRGITGIMLYEGYYSNIDVLAMLCPANPAFPDPRAAANALGPLSKLIPELSIDLEPLYKEAEDIENKIKEQANFDKSADIQQLYG